MKKSLIFFLIFILVTGLLVGCGSKETYTSTKELKHLGPWDNFDPNEDKIAKELEELTGYKVEYFMLPAENANEKVNLELAGGAQYNTVKLTRAQYEHLVGEGALLDITELIEEYGQNLKKVIGEESWDAVKVNGKIYGIPEKNSSDNINFGLLVRKDILEKHGLKVPTTIEEFKTVCKALGDAGLMTPFATNQTIAHGISGAFGIPNEWVEENGKLVYFAESDGFKEYINFMKELYQIGALGKDWETLDYAKAQERFVNGDAAILNAAWWNAPGIYQTLRDLGVKNPEDIIVYIPSLVGPDGKKGVYRDKGIPYVTAIPKYMSKTAPDAIKWMDSKVEKENFKKFVIGKEGYHYTVKDGKYYPILENDQFSEKNNASWYLTGTNEKDYAIYWQARIRKNADMQHAWESLNEKADEYGVYSPIGFAPALKLWSENRQQLALSAEEFAKLYIAGSKSKSDIENLRSELKTNNLDEVTEEVNQWFEANK